MLREVSIESSAELRSAPPELLHHTRYYIQSPYPPWPSFLVADAHPHLAMTSLLLRPSLSVRFCAVAAPPFWRLVPGLFHPVCPNVLIRWILPRVSARCDGNSPRAKTREGLKTKDIIALCVGVEGNLSSCYLELQHMLRQSLSGRRVCAYENTASKAV